MKKLIILLTVISFSTVKIHAQSSEANTKTIIEQTCKQAGEQNKKAFIMVSASWCFWCHKMEDNMNNPLCKKFFENNFIIKHIIFYERGDKANLNTPGAEEFLKEHHANNQGIPVWFIFNENGKELADSQIRPEGESLNIQGKNVGCPSEKDEIDYFIKVLKLTTHITATQEKDIRKVFSGSNANTKPLG